MRGVDKIWRLCAPTTTTSTSTASAVANTRSYAWLNEYTKNYFCNCAQHLRF